MTNYVRAAEAIREAFDCVCIIIHHCGWDESHPRGHSSLPAAVDAQLSLVRDGTRPSSRSNTCATASRARRCS